MSTIIRPVGPEEPRTYWVRRLVVVLAAIVVVVLVAALVNSMLGGSDAAEEPAGAEDPAPTEPTGEPEPTADPTVACRADQLGLSVATTERTYPAGMPVTFVVQITNTSQAPCTVDAGEAARGVLVTSGSDRIWSNLDCPAEGAGERLLALPPGGMDEARVEWARVRSDESCRTDLPEPRPGTYKAAVELAGATSEQTTFDLG